MRCDELTLQFDKVSIDQLQVTAQEVEEAKIIIR